ncbi:MAG: uracil-DNA glycosylase [Candidatus Woesearchaeota archaeon]
MSKQEQLDKLKQKIESELVCPLKDSATNIVFGKGNPNADILIIGEAPGANEDLQGIPFVGKAGKNLDSFLNLINLSLDDVYIANILKYRPPKNRNPTKEEIINHTPYLVEQIKIIQPKVILPLGKFATEFCLAEFDTSKIKTIAMSEVHGKIYKINNLTIIPMYHPAAMIYNQKLKITLEEDFVKVGNYLGLKVKETNQKSLNNFN